MRRSFAASLHSSARPVLTALLFALLRVDVAYAQATGSVPDSASLLLQQGSQARREAHAASVRRAIALWEQARAAAERSGDRAAQAEALHLQGEALSALSVYDSASAALNAALALRRSAGDRVGEGQTLVELARVDMGVGRNDSARARARAALSLLGGARVAHTAAVDDVEAGARTVLGGVARQAGQADSALLQLRRALELRRRRGDARGEGEVLQVLGDVYRFTSRFDSASAVYRRALALQRRASDPRGSAWTLRVAGLALSRLGKRDSGIAHARGALALFREVGDRRGEALALADIGRYHRGGDAPDSAMAAARQALAILREVGDRWGEAGVLADIASGLRAGGERDSAGLYLGWSLERYRETGDPWAEGWVLGELGHLHGDAGRLDSAAAYYSRSVSVRRRIGARGSESLVLNALGSVLARLRQPDSARAAFVRARRIARAVGDPWTEAEALEHLADLRRARPGPPAARAAAALYDSAAWTLSRVVSGIGRDDDRLTFREDAGLWANWTLAWLASEGAVGQRRARLAALAAGERGRARALLELMRRSGARTGRSAGASAPAGGPGADLAAEGRSLIRRAHAGAGAILLYQLAGDTLLRWMVPPSGTPVVFPAAVTRDSLAALVRAARGALGADEAAGRGARLEPPAAPSPAPYRGALDRLAHLLLPDSLVLRLPPGSEVVIVTGGVLNLVPFAALPLPGGEYLGARHALRYTPSLAALGAAEARPAVGRGELSHALVVGDPAMPTVTTYTGEQVELGPLPGAGREADEVAEELGARALHGSGAGEKAVVSLLARAPLVHLATHGFAYARQDRARDSFVALAPGEGEDGLLTVAEVLSRPGGVRAELVVLSACQSGLGSLQDAEGTVGLQRAFLARGARSVMVSLWSVSDRATEALMRGFYKHWLGDADHPGKAEALRRAQAEVRRMPGMESPVFWAAFQLAGAR
jgi:tetratricopeptide (TPR) repeat protein